MEEKKFITLYDPLEVITAYLVWVGYQPIPKRTGAGGARSVCDPFGLWSNKTLVLFRRVIVKGLTRNTPVRVRRYARFLGRYVFPTFSGETCLS